MSVDTYLKGKNLSTYHPANVEDISILLSRTLATWASSIRISARRFLFWSSLGVEVLPLKAIPTALPDSTASRRSGASSPIAQ